MGYFFVYQKKRECMRLFLPGFKLGGHLGQRKEVKEQGKVMPCSFFKRGSRSALPGPGHKVMHKRTRMMSFMIPPLGLWFLLTLSHAVPVCFQYLAGGGGCRVHLQNLGQDFSGFDSRQTAVVEKL